MITLVLHITIALTSLVVTSVTFLRPSAQKLYAAYSLIALTLGSGTFLVLSTHAPLASACISGLIYTGGSLTATFVAQTRLSAKLVKNK